MKRPLFLLAPLLSITLLIGSSGLAAEEYDEEVQGIVDQLREITDRARRERAADRWLIHSLEDLITQHDWPWRQELLLEDFSDGDYTQQPQWEVLSGEFWVDASLGLRSRTRPMEATARRQEESPKQDLGSALLGALLQEALRTESPKKETATSQREGPAEILLPLRIPDAFALRVEFSAHNAPSEDGQLLFGLYQEQRSRQGYQLVINTGAQPNLDILQLLNGRSLLIDSVKIADLNDGQSHEVEWRKNAYGEIEVLVDQQSVLRTRDRAFAEGFDALGFVNKGGDFGVRSVQLHGQSRR